MPATSRKRRTDSTDTCSFTRSRLIAACSRTCHNSHRSFEGLNARRGAAHGMFSLRLRFALHESGGSACDSDLVRWPGCQSWFFPLCQSPFLVSARRRSAGSSTALYRSTCGLVVRARGVIRSTGAWVCRAPRHSTRMTLNGVLQVYLQGGYDPPDGQTFKFLLFPPGSLSGSFSSVSSGWQVVYDNTDGYVALVVDR
jgi:hypothetical protein